ncbi:MAG: DUF5703 domain-containing protein, partial [Opitutaceae bacterium]
MTTIERLRDLNVVYHSPGQSDRSAMPLGNGELAVSLWVEQDGDLQLYLARSDALTELDRNVKLGKIRVSFEPNPFGSGLPFRQELNLTDGHISIVAGEEGQAKLTVFVASDSPTVHVQGEFTQPTRVSARYETWRSDWSKPAEFDGNVRESPDVVLVGGDETVFYHQNAETLVPFLTNLQGLGETPEVVCDTLTGRIFGGCLRCDAQSPTKHFTLSVTTHSAQVEGIGTWLTQLHELVASAGSVESALSRTRTWWNHYWQQSWIFVRGDRVSPAEVSPAVAEEAKEARNPLEFADSASGATRAYVLTKFMTRACSLGSFPIYYNGMLFNLMPGGGEHLSIHHFGTGFTSVPSSEPTLELNPDERSWCTEQLWQNLRLPYYSMLARGETESLRKMFAYYRRFWDLNRARALRYHRAQGQHSGEMTLSFGLQTGAIYGVDRKGKPDGYSENRWGGAIEISPGLELLYLMLDYCHHTGDDSFLREQTLPYAKDIFLYVSTRFRQRQAGKMVLGPLQSVETYFDTTDPLPVVAGLKACSAAVLELPRELVNDRDWFEEFHFSIPDLPTERWQDRPVLAPARVYQPQRQNIEIPEFYAIYPFRLVGIAQPALAFATWNKCLEVANSDRDFVIGETVGSPSYSGWQYHGMVAARLGLADYAKRVLEHNAGLKNPGCRFPAMWGPIYDAVPDMVEECMQQMKEL